MSEVELQEQHKKHYDWLKQYQWQKGQSGNPGGAPKGKRLKTFALEMLANMDDEEKSRFLKLIDPKTVWEMAEGKAKQDVEADINLTSKLISVDE